MRLKSTATNRQQPQQHFSATNIISNSNNNSFSASFIAASIHNSNSNASDPNRISMNEDSRNDILNGSNTSTSSASQLGANDDLDIESNGDADRKRAHHNALERKRRDHIKDSFHTLRDAIPNIRGEKTSRAQILKAATDYIKIMRTRNTDYQSDIDSLRKQNQDIENQIRQLEKAKLSSCSEKLSKTESGNYFDTTNSLNSDTDYKDNIKFELNETSTPNVLHVSNNNNSTRTTTTATFTKNPTGIGNVLVLNKPLTTTLTTTALSGASSSAANPKKFKTIINTKNNINIINLNSNHTITSSAAAAAAAAATAAAANAMKNQANNSVTTNNSDYS